MFVQATNQWHNLR